MMLGKLIFLTSLFSNSSLDDKSVKVEDFGDTEVEVRDSSVVDDCLLLPATWVFKYVTG